MDSYDVVVIGAGPAGYVSAIRAAQLGLKTACIDEWVGKDGKPTLGGTCLNVGCIPSKALLDSSEEYYHLGHRMDSHGIKLDNLQLDVPTMIHRKDKIVQTLTKGIEGLFKKNAVTWIKGHGQLASNTQVDVESTAGEEPFSVTAKNIIIATGSSPRHLPDVALDGEYIVDSSGGLDFQEVPKKLGIIGAGVIGLELGSVWKRLGSEVVLLEAMDRFLFFADDEIADAAFKEFSKQGLNINLDTRVLSAKREGEGVSIRYQDGEGDHEISVDRLIVAVGRKPNRERLNAKGVDLQVDERGYIHVDDHCATSQPGIYAIGDVVRGPMLAHKGSEEGVMVAERIAGQDSHVNYQTIPGLFIQNLKLPGWAKQNESYGLQPGSIAQGASLSPQTGELAQ